MGSTFVNIQVHARLADKTALLDDLGECLRTVLHEDGYLAAEAGEPYDRTILVAAGQDWIGVYDELCDEQRQDVADRLASELSRQLKTHVVTVLVHDSDVLCLELFASGILVDQFNNNPDYFGKVSAEEKTATRGKPEHWSAVLTPGTQCAALRTAWRKKKAFAEDTLRETAQLLGLGEDHALLGFRYLREGEGQLGDAQLQRLGFRHAVRPRSETHAEGPPRFERHSSSVKIAAILGSTTQLGSAGVHNSGGSSRGLSVVLSGEALDRGLLSITSADLVVTIREERTVLSSPARSELRGEQRVSVALFPTVDIPAAFKPQNALELLESRGYSPKAINFHTNIFGEGLSLGTGALHVQLVPDSAPEGQDGAVLQAEIFPPDRLPLRAPESARPGPRRSRFVLFARVSMDLEQSEAAAAAAPMIERFCEFLGPEGALSLVVHPSEERARVRTSTAKLSGFVRSARWQKLKSELGRAARVGGERKVPVEDFFARHPSDGFSFGGTLIRHEVADDLELPTLVLWFDLEHIPTERVSAAEVLFESFMAEIMAHHSGVQALVGRTTTVYSGSLDMSEYESACGIRENCTLRRSWLGRFVREVPVGTLWLGESLQKLIPELPPYKRPRESNISVAH